MRKRENRKPHGFTIIEVVLVLAIAGLIFLIVFLALPALQKSQRDTQRKNDLSRVLSQLANYQSNNQGKVPSPNVPTTGKSGQASVDDFATRYLTVNGSEQFNDPATGNQYGLQFKGSNYTDLPANTGDMFYYTTAKCNGEAVEAGAGPRSVAVAVKLERGSILCQSN